VQAHTLGEVGNLGTVLLRVYSGTVLPIFIEIGLHLTDKEQNICWHSFFWDTVYSDSCKCRRTLRSVNMFIKRIWMNEWIFVVLRCLQINNEIMISVGLLNKSNKPCWKERMTGVVGYGWTWKCISDSVRHKQQPATLQTVDLRHPCFQCLRSSLLERFTGQKSSTHLTFLLF